MANSNSWSKIFRDYKILKHNFNSSPFYITAKEIKTSCQGFKKVGEKEVRILCKHDSRKDRPKIFVDNNLFILPVKNGRYAIIKGEGYVDIPTITSDPIIYDSKIDFQLDTASVGNSEMQHLDYAYAISIIRTFMKDPTLVLTIRGRKYTPKFNFKVRNQEVEAAGVQTEVDAGYEGKEKVVLIEAKNSSSTNVIIRQLYYPFKQWQTYTKKKVFTLFFEKDHKNNLYGIWLFGFTDKDDYNSVKLIKSSRYRIKT